MTEGIEILLVEDNPDDAELTLLTLQKERLANNIRVARDGQEALDYLFCEGEFASRPIDQLPKLVLLDLKLPKIDGLDVLRRIKQDPRTKAVPVVILTSSKEEKDITEGYHLGVNAYVQKPVAYDQFRSAVTNIGFFWLLTNHAPLIRPCYVD